MKKTYYNFIEGVLFVLEKLVIQGLNTLNGEIAVHGAKNSALPILAASILNGSKNLLYNCPRIKDIDCAVKILNRLGCATKQNGSIISIDSYSLSGYDIPESLMAEMRGSIVFLGALTARCKKARICYPGGCEIGQRPIDIHLEGLRRLGVIIDEEHGMLNCRVDKPLTGAKISLPFPSVGATENIMLAAVTARGETVIGNAAAEPEIADLADYLNKCGAIVRGAGENTIYIQGVAELHGAEHTIIPDRIVACTYLCAAAITGGSLLVKNMNPLHIEAVLELFEQSGCRMMTEPDRVHITAKKPPDPIHTARTLPYPGFPTDIVAPMTAIATIADGTSIFVENIFENRYKHVAELIKMGADISVEGRAAVIRGVDRLYGASVKATDLRGGAALVLAGLAAEGTTYITEMPHIDRGYECIEKSLSSVGAKITRLCTP
ncbi:MAG: UDP-N-acetylglucosamine 1-carboxyvinyltransferase [Oscillospiraceae bacterium]|nr:UDP-N-acetylglucosamine 1-carboxyvinyltransferase [Oscillospiraceae bacterium]